jgi:hypothetical protein
MLRSWGAGLLFLLAVACAGQEQPEVAQPPVSSAPDAATPTAGGPQDIVGEGTPLEPGAYTFSPFEPAVVFELGDGWEGGHTNPEFFDVWRGMRVAVMFGRPGFLLRGDERVPTDELTTDEALQILREQNDTSSRAPALVLDGQTVPSVIVRSSAQTELFGGPGGTFTADPDFRNRIAAVDVDGTLVLVIVSAKTPMELEDRLAVTEMLGTIRLGD